MEAISASRVSAFYDFVKENNPATKRNYSLDDSVRIGTQDKVIEHAEGWVDDLSRGALTGIQITKHADKVGEFYDCKEVIAQGELGTKSVPAFLLKTRGSRPDLRLSASRVDNTELAQTYRAFNYYFNPQKKMGFTTTVDMPDTASPPPYIIQIQGTPAKSDVMSLTSEEQASKIFEVYRDLYLGNGNIGKTEHKPREIFSQDGKIEDHVAAAIENTRKYANEGLAKELGTLKDTVVSYIDTDNAGPVSWDTSIANLIRVGDVYALTDYGLDANVLEKAYGDTNEQAVKSAYTGFFPIALGYTIMTLDEQLISEQPGPLVSYLRKLTTNIWARSRWGNICFSEFWSKSLIKSAMSLGQLMVAVRKEYDDSAGKTWSSTVESIKSNIRTGDFTPFFNHGSGLK